MNEIVKQRGNLGRVSSDIVQQVRKSYAVLMPQLVTHIRERYFGGQTLPDMLHSRTGHLKNSVRPMFPVQVEGMMVRSGILFGKIYAFTHVGPKGQSKTIRPKNKQWLTVPLGCIEESKKALFTSAGQLKGGATSGLFANTFIRKSKAGNLIIFGQSAYQKGKKMGQGKGKITPLFILKKQVTIPYRIHPTDIFKWFKEKFVSDLASRGIIARGTVTN